MNYFKALKEILIQFLTKSLGGPARVVAGWVASLIIDTVWSGIVDFYWSVVDYFKKKRDKKAVDNIKKAEDQLHDAKTKEEKKSALRDIARNTRDRG